MEVNIYINIYHTGNLKKGNGTYTIALEYIKKSGEPETRLIYGGFTGTTNNRTALHAVLIALQKLNKQCLVTIHINIPYVTEPFTQDYIKHWDTETWIKKGKPMPNADLWKQVLEQTKYHTVKFNYVNSNQYTDYMASQLKYNKFEYQEDKYV